MPEIHAASRRSAVAFAVWTIALILLFAAAPRCFAAGEAAQFEGFGKIDADPDNSAERGGRLEFQEYLINRVGRRDRL